MLRISKVIKSSAEDTMLKKLHHSQFTSKATFFRVQKFGWKLMGFCLASDEVTQFQLLFFIANCMEVLIYGIFQFWFIYENREKLVVIFDALTPVATQVPTVLRLLILVWYRNDLKYVLDYLQDAFVNAKEKCEIEINARANQVSSILLGALAVLGYITLLFFYISPIIRDIIRVNGGMSRLHDIPFKAIFPFEYNYTPMYEIIYILGCYSGHITMAAACAGEGLFFGLCAHTSAQFDIVSLRLKRLIDEEIDYVSYFVQKTPVTTKLYNYDNTANKLTFCPLKIFDKQNASIKLV